MRAATRGLPAAPSVLLYTSSQFTLALLIGAFLRVVLIGAVLLLIPALLMAQVDSTAVQDKTGIFGALIDKGWATLTAAIASGVIWLIRRGGRLMQNWHPLGIWTVLYFLNLGLNVILTFLGLPVVDPVGHIWDEAGAVALAQTIAGASVYYFGGHKVPKAEASGAASTARRSFGP